jgi:hypothetical protein
MKKRKTKGYYKMNERKVKRRVRQASRQKNVEITGTWRGRE